MDHRRVPLDLDLPDVHGTLARRQRRRAHRPPVLRARRRARGRPRAAAPGQRDRPEPARAAGSTCAAGRLRAEKTDLAVRRHAPARARPCAASSTLAGPVDLARARPPRAAPAASGSAGTRAYEGRPAGGGLAAPDRRAGWRARRASSTASPCPATRATVSWKRGPPAPARPLALGALGGTRPRDPGPAARGPARCALDADGGGHGRGGAEPPGLRRRRRRPGRRAPPAASRCAGRAGAARAQRPRRLDLRRARRRAHAARGPLRTGAPRTGGSRCGRRTCARQPRGRAVRPHRARRARRPARWTPRARTSPPPTSSCVRVRRALGAADAQPAGLAGAGAFHGRWRGTLRAASSRDASPGQDVGYLGVSWGRAEWAGSLSTPEVLRRTRWSCAGRRRSCGSTGGRRTGVYGEDDALDVRLRLARWPAADLARALRLGPAAAGAPLGRGPAARAAQRARWARLRSPPRAAATTACPSRTCSWPWRADGATAPAAARAGRAWAAARVSFHGTAPTTASTTRRPTLADVERPALRLRLAGGPAAGAGACAAALLLQGTLERPRLQARSRSPRLFLGDEGVGALEATLQRGGDGARGGRRPPAARRAWTWQLGRQRGRGRALRAAPAPQRARDQPRSVPARALSRRCPRRVPPGGQRRGRRSPGRCSARARWRCARRLAWTWSCCSRTIPVRNAGPIALTLRDGRLELRSLHLARRRHRPGGARAARRPPGRRARWR